MQEIQIKREIEILKKFHHINIIRVKDILEDSKNIYIIMEYCEKGELFNRIIEEICLEDNEAAYYFYQLINGLEYMHKIGIVHRDLKPENLLINKNNILKIIDFGLSNYYDKNKLLSTPCGSPYYAAPEIISCQKYDGILVDIWNTGIILYAMLCGSLPFNEKDRAELYKHKLKCQINFPEHLEKDALDLLKKILVNDPNRRISIEEIKKHPFYIKGRKEFIKMNPDLIKRLRKKYVNRIQKKEIDFGKIEEKEGNKNIKKITKIDINKRKIIFPNLSFKGCDNNFIYRKKYNIRKLNQQIVFNEKTDNIKEIREIKMSNFIDSRNQIDNKKIKSLHSNKNLTNNKIIYYNTINNIPLYNIINNVKNESKIKQNISIPNNTNINIKDIKKKIKKNNEYIYKNNEFKNNINSTIESSFCLTENDYSDISYKRIFNTKINKNEYPSKNINKIYYSNRNQKNKNEKELNNIININSMSEFNQKLFNIQSNNLKKNIVLSLKDSKQQKLKKNEIDLKIQNIIKNQKNKGIYRSHIKAQRPENLSKIIQNNTKDKNKRKLHKTKFELNIGKYIKTRNYNKIIVLNKTKINHEPNYINKNSISFLFENEVQL